MRARETDTHRHYAVQGTTGNIKAKKGKCRNKTADKKVQVFEYHEQPYVINNRGP